MPEASGYHAQHNRRALTSFSVAEHSDPSSSTSNLSCLHNFSRATGMDYSRPRPFPISNQDALADHRPAPSLLDASIQGLSRYPKPWNILKFYGAGVNESPWVPPGIIPEDHAGQGRDGNSPTASRDAYTSYGREWRSSGPSECDTLPMGHLPSDSGYESRRTKQSIANASVYGDVDQGHETQSLTGRLDDLDPFVRGPSDPSCTGNPDGNQSYSVNSVRLSMFRAQNNAVSTRLVCPDCKSHLKTKSELNKHKQRHSKPHKCDVPECTRKQGFSTSNDLDRHKRSVHRDTDIRGPRYRCHLTACHTKDKIWPRADNFRSHLRRVHRVKITAEDDLSQYVVPTLQPLSLSRFNQNSLVEGIGGVSSTIESFGYTPYNQTMPASMWANHQPQDLDMAQLTVPGKGLQTELDISDASPISTDTSRTEVSDTRQANRDMSSNRAPDRIHHFEQPGGPRSPDFDSHEPGQDSNTCSPVQLSEGAGLSRLPEVVAESTKHTAEEDDLSVSSDTELQSRDYDMAAPLAGDDILHASPNDGDDLADDDRSQTSDASDMLSEDNPVEGKTTPGSPSETTQLDGACDYSLPSTQNAPMTEREMLGLLKHFPTEMLKRFMEKKQAPLHSQSSKASQTTQDSAQHPCPQCEKTFQRKCELKKHIKRHDKPYGCTFAMCEKTFGSKNDWKRHENSQHIHLEVWKCNERLANGSGDKCGKVFPLRQQFKIHLQSAHSFQDLSKLETELYDSRFGRNCDSRFWCGFCASVIENTDTAVHAWTLRFNHIDDHFCGRNDQPKKTISDWKHMDSDHSNAGLTPSSGRADVSEDVLGFPYSVAAPPSNNNSRAEAAPIPAGKRKLGDDSEHPGSRRPKKESTLMWNCCNCSMQSSFRFSGACVATDGCTHHRCDNCTLS